jgi:hypothetical protein
MAEELGKEAVKSLIKPTPGMEIEFEENQFDYANIDEVTAEDLEAMDSQIPATEQQPEPTQAQPTTDWEKVARDQQAELARFKAEQSEREKSDFERRVGELPEAERAEFILNFYRERERASEMESIRRQQAETHPLSTVLLAPVLEKFDLEIEDAAVYASAMDSIEQKFADIINVVVNERVKQEMDKFYEGAGKEWGVKKLGDAQPAGLPVTNPVRNQYEQTRKEMLKPGLSKSVDDLASLLRQRSQAKSS